MLIENQKIKLQWNRKTKNHYINLGYNFTKMKDEFFVDVKDLPLGSGEKVDVVCDYCGKLHKKQYYSYIENRAQFPKDACYSCRAKKQHEFDYEKRKNKSFDKLEEFCKTKEYYLITKRDDYTDVYMQIEYHCQKHGYQIGTLDNMIHGHGCIKCQHEKISEFRLHSKDFVEEFINGINGNTLLNKNEYINSTESNLIIKCGLCNKNTYTVSFDTYKTKGQTCCRSCSAAISKNENIIKQILENNNIEFEMQKTFENCKDIRKLPFDFYLPDFNLIIEYDGEGHYRKKFYFNRCKNPCLSLGKTVYHDYIKTQYCKDNNINLLRIPYWRRKNIEVIILQKIKELSIINI
jgi:very-short-patch-repair endonuclease